MKMRANAGHRLVSKTHGWNQREVGANTVLRTSNKADPSLRSEIEETGRESRKVDNQAMKAEASASSAAFVSVLILI
jgi:hypothetical protein